MEECSVQAYAKINLSLDVVGRLENGYHLVKMIMQTVRIADEITVKRIPALGDTLGDIELTGEFGEEGPLKEMGDFQELVPLNEHNLIYKAARLMREEYGIKDGFKIHLTKKIPVAAGMAGGSTDAAATLKAINTLFDLGADEEKLRELGVKLGADVPYCIMGGTALAEGIGEKLTPLTPMPDCYIVVAKPPEGVSTAFVYGQIDSLGVKIHPDVDGMIEAIRKKDLKGVTDRLDNVLEHVTIPECPLINEIKKALVEHGAMGSLMSGSGPSVFGIFDDEALAKEASEYLRDTFTTCQVYLTGPQ